MYTIINMASAIALVYNIYIDMTLCQTIGCVQCSPIVLSLQVAQMLTCTVAANKKLTFHFVSAIVSMSIRFIRYRSVQYTHKRVGRFYVDANA